MAGGFGGMADRYLVRNNIYTEKELWSKRPVPKKHVKKPSPKARTFDEWKAKGYHVVRGEKAHRFREDGKALFSQKQVVKNDNFQNHGDGGWENIHNQSDLWDHPDFYDGWDNIGDKD